MIHLFTITVKTPDGETSKEFSNEILLSDAMEEMGISQNKPCGGNGTCGKCKVIMDGEEVLSCRTMVNSDALVYYTTQKENIQGITEGRVSKFNKEPIISEGYGLAVDIGTTTIAGYLYKFPECKCIKAAAVPNTQAEFGADVISRIDYCNNNGIDKLYKKVNEQIEKLAEDKKINKYVITGNTTMLHFLTGKNPEGIAVAPFIPESLFGEWIDNMYLPRCISAYVGADITMAVLASGMMEKKVSFLVDIGTNGEMVLWNNNELVCCSTAAGPAFEGAGISQGMLAVKGAINRVFIENGTLKYTTIDNAKAIGICGTGLIDAVSCMLKLGIIDESGYIEDSFEIGDSGVFITAKDVRQVQLAKSAIRSGIDTLVNECKIEYKDIESFYIAGGFGSYINKYNAAKIGLIPSEVLGRVEAIGNAAGNGAAMLLQSRECIEKSEIIAENAKTVELSDSAYFMEKYIDNMMF